MAPAGEAGQIAAAAGDRRLPLEAAGAPSAQNAEGDINTQDAGPVAMPVSWQPS